MTHQEAEKLILITHEVLSQKIWKASADACYAYEVPDLYDKDIDKIIKQFHLEEEGYT